GKEYEKMYNWDANLTASVLRRSTGHFLRGSLIAAMRNLVVRYTIDETLYSGARCVVYRGQWDDDGGSVLVKMLRAMPAPDRRVGTARCSTSGAQSTSRTTLPPVALRATSCTSPTPLPSRQTSLRRSVDPVRLTFVAASIPSV